MNWQLLSIGKKENRMDVHDSGPRSLLGHPLMLPTNKDAAHRVCVYALDALTALSTARNAVESPKSTPFLPNEISNNIQGFGN